MELFRFFRINYFNDINFFYDEFYKFLDQNLNNFFEKNNQKIILTKKKFPHYSINDIKFRLVRDIYLTKEKYEKIMFEMMNEKKLNFKEIYKKLFFNQKDLKKIDNLGHLVGLHSHSHPSLLENLTYEKQKQEYETNMLKISKLLNKSENEIKYMSHPSGSYNLDTLNILKEIGIELGFKQIMTIEREKGMKKVNNSFLEIARNDHADILNMIN